MAFPSTAPNGSVTALGATPLRIPTWLAFAGWSGGAGLAFSLILGAVAREESVVVPAPLPQVTLAPTPHAELEQTREHLRATLPWSNAHSLWGWGSVRLSAEPRIDEIGVVTIVDAPRDARVWMSRCEVRLVVDGEEARVRAEPVGGRMKTGDFYDALRMEIGIDVLRRMARAGEVHGDLCGEPFVLPETQRATLQGFVDAFDAMAMPNTVMDETQVELAPVDPDEVVEDPNSFLEQV